MRSRIHKAANDGLGLAGGDQFARVQAVAENRAIGGMIKPAITERDSGATAGAKLLFHLESPIPIGVPQRDDAATHRLRIKISAGGHGQKSQLIPIVADFPARDEIIGDDQSPKSRGKIQAPIVDIRHGKISRREKLRCAQRGKTNKNGETIHKITG